MTDLMHYMPLYAGYAAALGLLALACWRVPGLLPDEDDAPLKWAWVQLLGVIVCGVGIVAIGTWIYETDPAGALDSWRLPAEVGLELCASRRSRCSS